MNDKEKINASISMLKQLKRMVGFFMKKEISELIEQLERNDEIKSEPKQNRKSFRI
jgi:hypothetical protein